MSHYFFQGSRASVLLLSNLQLGDYTFKLTVTNILGESSSAEVHVNVKSGTLLLLISVSDAGTVKF